MATELSQFTKQYAKPGMHGSELGELAELLARPGQNYALELSFYPPFSEAQLQKLQDELISQGIELLSPVGDNFPTYPTIVRIEARAPRDGYGFALPFWVLMTLAIGAVGISTMLGWRIADTIKQHFIPILLAGIGATVLIAWVSAPKRA